MKPKAMCCTLLIVLFAFITLPVVWAGAQNQIELLSFHWGALGIVRGQTLRVSLINIGQERQLPLVSVVVRIHDTQGNVIAQTDETAVAPGQIRYFDFKRESLPFTGQTPDRLQFRAVVHVKGNRPDSPEDLRRVVAALIPSFELYDQGTGRTTESGMIGDIRTVISAD